MVDDVWLPPDPSLALGRQGDEANSWLCCEGTLFFQRSTNPDRPADTTGKVEAARAPLHLLQFSGALCAVFVLLSDFQQHCHPICGWQPDDNRGCYNASEEDAVDDGESTVDPVQNFVDSLMGNENGGGMLGT